MVTRRVSEEILRGPAGPSLTLRISNNPLTQILIPPPGEHGGRLAIRTKDGLERKRLTRRDGRCQQLTACSGGHQGDATSHLGWMAYKKRRLTTAMQSIILGPFEVTGVLLHCP